MVRVDGRATDAAGTAGAAGATDATGTAGVAGTTTSWVLVASCVGYAMVILDTTVVNVALPALSRSLQATTSGLQWVVDGYTLVFAVFLLSAGALGDRRGAKGVFLSGLGLFVLASLGCGLAPSTSLLVGARLVQGLGAALAVPSSLALVQLAYPERAARARAVGLWGAIAGVAAGLGPLLGGGLVDLFGWRSVFFVNLPVGLFGLLLGGRVLPRAPRHAHGLDLAGQASSLVCFAGLAVGLIEAGANGWGAPLAEVGLACFAGGAVAFVVVERHAAQPMLPPRLFSSATLSAAVAAGCCANLGFFGELFVMSLYLQDVRHLSPVATGLLLTPQLATTVVGSVLSGRVTSRVGARTPVLVGFGVGATGLAGLVFVTGASSPEWAIVPCLVGAGFGIAFAMMAATAAVMDGAPSNRSGVASGALNAARQLGGMIGVALLGGFVAHDRAFVGGLHLALGVAAAAFLFALTIGQRFVERSRRSAEGPTSFSPGGGGAAGAYAEKAAPT